MKKFAWMGVALVLAGCSSGKVVSSGAWVQKVSNGYKFTEGPAFDGKQYLYFTDIPNERIIRLDVHTKRESVYRENSGGANGLFFDPQGRLVACEGKARRVTRTDGDKATVLATYTPFANRLNSPNDLVIRQDGTIFFTDPRYGNRDSMEMKFEGVYSISPGGEVKLATKEIERPNGVILSNDEKILYVADAARKTIVAFDVQKDGSLTNPRVFAALAPDAKLGGVDGMTIDRQGNIYGAARGAIWVWDPKGALLNTIAIPEGPSNCTFVGNDLYVTARTSLYRVTLNTTAGDGGR